MARRLLTVIAAYMLQQLSILSAEPTDSVDYYTEQIISSTVYIQGRDTLFVNDTQVMPQGELHLISPNGIVISGGLEVELGGSLYISGGKQNYIRFLYNNVGSRIRRENELSNH